MRMIEAALGAQSFHTALIVSSTVKKEKKK